MKNSVIIFLVFLLVGFGGGYVFFQYSNTADVASPAPEATEIETDTTTPQESATTEEPKTVSAEAQIITDKGCLACHAVENLGLQGGATGPDLSQAFNNVEGKHGKPIDEFLKEPTSAVMSSVISGNPLTDEEVTSIVEALKIASEK
ncbi:cytochrome C [Bacillus sp. Marseille-P3661]|uniref:cytochrome C n=1 Tax=Bacillus sp. Marseille-P3661 TaxID=1936234 RepID=UPI000C84133E|nr:cytochrome C [Bacillus sp. Marseille-P3661]